MPSTRPFQTIADQVREALANDDVMQLGRIVDRLRRHGARHGHITQAFEKVAGIDPADFDALMYEYDTQLNRQGGRS